MKMKKQHVTEAIDAAALRNNQLRIDLLVRSVNVAA